MLPNYCLTTRGLISVTRLENNDGTNKLLQQYVLCMSFLYLKPCENLPIQPAVPEAGPDSTKFNIC